MAVSLTSSDLVRLPHLDASKTSALAASLLATAEKTGKKSKLPASLAKARKRLSQAASALDEALADRVAPGGDSRRALDADRAVDRVWSGLHDWAQGLAKLPDQTPEAKSAKAILSTLFSDGLTFTRLSFPAEWSEVETRIKLMADKKLDAAIRGLGGAAFLATIAATQREYADALGISGTASPAAGASAVKPALAQLQKSMRSYVAKVVALEDEDDAASKKLVATLLAPLVKAEADAPPPAPRKPKSKPADPGTGKTTP